MARIHPQIRHLNAPAIEAAQPRVRARRISDGGGLVRDAKPYGAPAWKVVETLMETTNVECT